jgi:2'-5' RNA ligase
MKITELFESDKIKTLYISRPLLNAEEFIDWAKSQGFEKTLEAKELHVTVAFSKKEVDWSNIKSLTNTIKISNGKRKVQKLGDEGAVVLRFESTELKNRWREILNHGASWDFDDYHPHVTITYDGKDLNLEGVKIFDKELTFGPEDIHEVDENYKEKVKEE